MVELVGDPCAPSELIVPVFGLLETTPNKSGAIWVSGGNLYYIGHSGGVVQL